MKFRKKGFVSFQADATGQRSYVVTRPLKWLGGDLVINADAAGGDVRVRVVDAWRRPIEGFDYDACVPLEGDAVRHGVSWASADLDTLAGTVIRLEFSFQHADLFAFLAAPLTP